MSARAGTDESTSVAGHLTISLLWQPLDLLLVPLMDIVLLLSCAYRWQQLSLMFLLNFVIMFFCLTLLSCTLACYHCYCRVVLSPLQIYVR